MSATGTVGIMIRMIIKTITIIGMAVYRVRRASVHVRRACPVARPLATVATGPHVGGERDIIIIIIIVTSQ